MRRGIDRDASDSTSPALPLEAASRRRGMNSPLRPNQSQPDLCCPCAGRPPPAGRCGAAAVGQLHVQTRSHRPGRRVTRKLATKRVSRERGRALLACGVEICHLLFAPALDRANGSVSLREKWANRSSAGPSDHAQSASRAMRDVFLPQKNRFTRGSGARWLSMATRLETASACLVGNGGGSTAGAALRL